MVDAVTLQTKATNEPGENPPNRPGGPKTPPTQGLLPSTGGPNGWLLPLGLLMLLLGGGLLVPARRRRQDRGGSG